MKDSLKTLLVVAILLGLALAIFLPAVYMGKNGHPDSRRVVEIGNLSSAIEQHRVTHHDYPPNFIDQSLIEQHVSRAFPMSQDSVPFGLDAAESLVFWLGGFTDDPVHPLTRAGGRMPLFNFDQTRLHDADRDGFPEYYPPQSKLPYAYFHHATYERASFTVSKATGIARPYLRDAPSMDFINPQSFQIISAGRDDHYGRGGRFPSGEGYAPEDMDNVTNFSEGTLGDRQE